MPISMETHNEPQLKLSDLPYLCPYYPRPQILTATFVQWMIQHFSSINNLEQTPLRNKIYDKIIRESGILITTDTAFEPEKLEKRPAIVVKRNAWRGLRLGIGNRMMGAVEPDGNEYFSKLWQGSHTLFCLGGEGAEAEILASEVAREVNGFSEVVRKAVDLHRLEVLDLGPSAKLEEASENYVIPVTVAYAWQDRWGVTEPNAPLINKLDLSAPF